MLNAETKRHIDAARDVLVGVAPNPMTQVDQITFALIYKFMDDMDQSAIKLGGEPSFFVGDLEPYAYSRLMDSRLGNQERMNLYADALTKFAEAKQLPELFRTIFRAAFLPYRSPETLGLFLKEINFFDYSHPEELGNAYEYLLSIMSAQGDAGQFRTPRHIIDFMVDVLNPTKTDRVLDPACGTGGFLVSSYNHILEKHDGKDDPTGQEQPLTPDERRKLMENFEGYDIDPSMVRIAQVNMYLHLFKNPKIFQYDSLTSEDRWNDKFDVILANPPFMSPKGGIKPHNKFGIQSNRSEVLFVDYILEHLKPQGRTAIIVPEGVLFQTGNAYKSLRKQLIEHGLHAIVSLPSGVFQPYSGVKTSILFIDKAKGKNLSSVLFLDIESVGLSLGASKKILDSNDLPGAMQAIEGHLNGAPLPSDRIIRLWSKEEIAANDFTLAQSTYRRATESSTDFPMLTLETLCHIVKGKSSSTKTEPGPYPLYVTAASPKTSDHFDFDTAGVAVPLISSRGHGVAEVSRVHFLSGQYALADLLALVAPKDSEALSPRYLYWILDGSKGQLASLMKGAANVGMKVSDLATLEIPLPSREMQLRIVTELDKNVSLIEGARQVIGSWKPRIEIDRDWPVFALEDVAVVDWGNTTLTKSAYVENGKYLGVSAAGPDGRMLHQEHGVGVSVLSAIGANCGRMFFPKEPFTAIKNTMTITPDQEFVLPKFLYYSLESNQFPKRGAGQPFIAKGDVVKYQIPIPSLELQERIVRGLEEEQAIIDGNAKLIDVYESRIRQVIGDLW